MRIHSISNRNAKKPKESMRIHSISNSDAKKLKQTMRIQRISNRNDKKLKQGKLTPKSRTPFRHHPESEYSLAHIHKREPYQQPDRENEIMSRAKASAGTNS